MERYDQAQLDYIDGELHISDVPLSRFLEKYPTPLYLYSQKILEHNFKEFANEAKKSGLEDSLICFALKANNNKKLLKILRKLGAGADIVSGGELLRAMDAGIKPHKIVFSGVGKTEWEIKLALKKGIYSFNVESLEELELINELAGKMKKRARVAIRLNPKVQAKTHKHISTGFKTHKFGILCEDIVQAYGRPPYWEHVDLIGISFHIGSQLTCLEATKEALIHACECAKQLPANLEFIDVGGGLGVTYHKDTPAPSVSEYMQLISETIKEHFPRPIRVVFEPGRRIVASSGFFITKVLRNKESEGHNFVIVDGGMNDFVRPSLYEAYHEIYPLTKKAEINTTDIVGPICETADCFGVKRNLPKLDKGDLLAITDTGAYGYSMSSNYNLRTRPAEFLITRKGKLKTIRKAELLIDILN